MENLIKILTLLFILSFNTCFTPNSGVIKMIRNKILEKSKDYTKADIERVRTSDELIKAVAADANNENEVIKLFDTSFKWRKINVNKEFTDTSFPLEVYKTGWLNYLGIDQGNKLIFLAKLTSWNRGSDKFEQLYKQYIIYSVEKVNDPKYEVILIGDATDITTSNIDVDLFLFLATTALKYYSYMNITLIGINFPAIIEAPLRVTLSAAGKYGATCKMITPIDLHKYVDKTLLPKYLKGTRTDKLNAVPAGCKPLEYFDRVKFTSDEIRDIYKLFNGFK